MPITASWRRVIGRMTNEMITDADVVMKLGGEE